MKKTLWIFCFIAFLVGLIAYANADVVRPPREKSRRIAPLPEPEKPKAVIDNSCGSHARPFVVAIWPSVPPFGWIEVVRRSMEVEVYEPYGLFYELIKAVAEYNNKEVHLYPTLSFKKAEEAVEAGKADILLGYYYDNNPYTSFQPLYPAIMQNPIVIITLKGAMPEEKALQALTDKVGVMRTDENLYTLMRSMIPNNMRIQQVPSAQEAFQLLLSHKADFMITSRYSAEAEIRRFKISSIVEISPAIKYPAVFFAVAKKGACKKEIMAFFKQHMEPIIKNHEEMGNLLRSQLEAWEDRFLYEEPMQETNAPQPTDADTPPSEDMPVHEQLETPVEEPAQAETSPTEPMSIAQ